MRTFEEVFFNAETFESVEAEAKASAAAFFEVSPAEFERRLEARVDDKTKSQAEDQMVEMFMGFAEPILRLAYETMRGEALSEANGPRLVIAPAGYNPGAKK